MKDNSASNLIGILPSGASVVENVSEYWKKGQSRQARQWMRERCLYAELYKGLREPKCGCLACWRKWVDSSVKTAATEAAKLVRGIKITPLDDCAKHANSFVQLALDEAADEILQKFGSE